MQQKEASVKQNKQNFAFPRLSFLQPLLLFILNLIFPYSARISKSKPFNASFEIDIYLCLSTVNHFKWTMSQAFHICLI